MKTIAVAFLWHLHQPYYTDPLTHTSPFPWVRLHATKGYFDMGVLLQEHPEMRATVNLTPSLLLQIQEQTHGTVQDTFFLHAACPAADLSAEQRAFILRHFFAANWDTLIRPHDRYHGLLIQRGRQIRERDAMSLTTRFSTQDFLDLQVWHNLAWFGHRALARYPALKELIIKGRQFTEADKHEVLSTQRHVLTQLLPLFRQLADNGQIELSTTPFFHPILPLLINTDLARRSRPESTLPATLAQPEDAREQLRMAVEFHTSVFGRRPMGLWPSEGSVCPEMVPMLGELGVQWAATDEGVLAASCEGWNRDAQLYRPYLFSREGSEIAFFFRDREISDAVGFTYARNDPHSAAADFGSRLAAIAQRSPDQRPVVSVILDGENPWEYYPDGGESFLRTLYANMIAGRQGEIGFQTITPERELLEHPPMRRLERLHTGSWINADLRIWIGHHEDNDAWERLGRTRRFLLAEQHRAVIPEETVQAAWNELYAAEGSDWFWWYGDEFVTEYKGTFDELFRMHLGNVFRILLKDVPEFLRQPVWSPQSLESTVQQPASLIAPCIDGIVTGFFEWRAAGYIEGQPPQGSMYKRAATFHRVYFGFDLEQLYLRFDPVDVLQKPPVESENPPAETMNDMAGRIVQVQFLEPNHIQLVFTAGGRAPDHFSLFKSADGSNYFHAGTYETIRGKKIIELMVPVKDLGFGPGSLVHLVIKVLKGGLECERLPTHGPLTLRVPDETFEATMWKA